MIKFTKMHGAGNDYIYVYTPDYPIQDPSSASIEWSKPHFGIGSDGLILIGKSDVADFSMHIYNNDGSEAMMCGNGIRCLARFAYESGIISSNRMLIETKVGSKEVFIDDKDFLITVNMGCPIWDVDTILYDKKGLRDKTL